jgi:hypothetical protein
MCCSALTYACNPTACVSSLVLAVRVLMNTSLVLHPMQVDVLLGPSATNHTIAVKAFGIDSNGHPDGVDTILPGASADVRGSCSSVPQGCGPAGSPPAAQQCPLGAWCYGVPCYWQNRAAETVYVENEFVRAGVNTAFGGTVFSLHRVDSTVSSSLFVLCTALAVPQLHIRSLLCFNFSSQS